MNATSDLDSLIASRRDGWSLPGEFVSTRLLPAGLGKTQVRVDWLVDQGAVEGKDYSLEELMPFWQLTSEQDWEICRAAQLGVQSSGYRPGPFSTYKEYNVDAFARWHLKSLSADR